MATRPPSSKMGVLVIMACFPVLNTCSSVTGSRFSSAASVPDWEMVWAFTKSCIRLPSISSRFRPVMDS